MFSRVYIMFFLKSLHYVCWFNIVTRPSTILNWSYSKYIDFIQLMMWRNAWKHLCIILILDLQKEKYCYWKVWCLKNRFLKEVLDFVVDNAIDNANFLAMKESGFVKKKISWVRISIIDHVFNTRKLRYVPKSIFIRGY